jgi:hypothetical protein
VPRFVDNVDTIVSKLGTQDVGLVWGLSMVNWQNDSDLEDFLDAITRPAGGL